MSPNLLSFECVRIEGNLKSNFCSEHIDFESTMNENLIRRKLAINPIYFIPLNTFKLRIRHKNLITCIPSFHHTIISLHSLILLFKASFHICNKLLHQTINGKNSILKFFVYDSINLHSNSQHAICEQLVECVEHESFCLEYQFCIL